MGPKQIFVLVAALVGSLSALGQTDSRPGNIQRIAMPHGGGIAASLRVPDVPLVFTGQIAATDVAGDPAAHVVSAIRALEATLTKAGSDLTRVVRLNAYVASDQAIATVETAVARRFTAAPPAFTLVRTPLAEPQALVAFEAVATSSRASSSVEVLDAATAVLPAGGKIFISGQAERGTDLGAASKATMTGLHRTLAHLGLKKTDVVQVKAFIKPFSDRAAATREIAASFDGAPVPPIVIMEWVSELFAEIELVASASALPNPTGDVIAYSALPWLNKSPRYSHVCHVAAGTPLIFVGAINGGDGGDPRTQMKTIFERLGSTLFEAGSSYRNLAKATYYLNDRTARALLGDIRGVYFDPARAPAASALGVNGLGYPGRAAMIDVIAVPVK